MRLTRRQLDLLVLGRVAGRDSPNLRKLSGIAYLCGTDTWVGPSQFHCEQDLRSHRLAILGQSLELQRRARHLDRVAEELDRIAWSAAR